ncbi:MAG: hypothetical protein U9Q37_10195 [Euryarchaeota archaeon]|nr:hypothetical protein [Euryarchaeota archaeon]
MFLCLYVKYQLHLVYKAFYRPPGNDFTSDYRIEDIRTTPDELIEMVDAKTGFVVDALLEGKILLDDGTIKDARSRLVDSLKRLNAKRLKHSWFIPRDDLRAVMSFD